MSNTPEPQEVELICGCCDRRDKVNPKTAREWPECCGKQMDRYEDDGRNPGWSWGDTSSMLKIDAKKLVINVPCPPIDKAVEKVMDEIRKIKKVQSEEYSIWIDDPIG